MIEGWARDKAGDWLVMVYLDEGILECQGFHSYQALTRVLDWNCVEYAPAWESVVDGLQGMIGLGRISMRASKGLGASLALSGEDGLLLPTLVMYRDGRFMRSTHISSMYGRDSLRVLVAKTYEFVHKSEPPPSPPSSPLPPPFLTPPQLPLRIHPSSPLCAHYHL
jgi:hypothetical protein